MTEKGSSRHRRMLASLSALAILGAAHAADDSVLINKSIKAAIAAGKSEYVLPAGSINLSNPILIPEGTKNFTLRGAGKGRTLLKADNTKVGYAIRAGAITMLHNNWGVTNQKNVEIANVAEGDTNLKLADVSGVRAGDYLALWDDSYVEHSQFPGGDRNMNHAELTKVTAVDAANKAVTLDRPTARSYSLRPKVALTNAYVLKNLTIKDIGFDGAVAGSTYRNNGIVQVGLSDGVHLENLDVQSFSTRAVLVNWTRDVEIDGVTIRDGQFPESPGSAYGVTVCRSRDVYVHDCLTTETRHAYVTHNGSTDVRYEDCVADGNNGNFDTHGCDERRITYLRCKATGSVNMGSDAWRGGGREFNVQDCVFGGAFHYAANTSGIVFRNTSLYGISMERPGGTKDEAVAGARFFDCSFPNLPAQGLIWEGGDFGRMEFDRCTFMTEATSWGSVLCMKKLSGKLVFNSCLMVSNVTRGYVPIWVSAPGLDLVLRDCDVVSAFGTMAGVQFGAGFAAQASLTGNRFYTNSKKNAFFVNDTKQTIADGGNAVRPAKDAEARMSPRAGVRP